MIRIEPAGIQHASLIARLGKITFIAAHGHSASAADIEHYVTEKYTEEKMRAELQNPLNRYHLLYCDDQPAGFSNLVLNAGGPNLTAQNIAKLDRLYFLQEFNGRGLGLELMKFNINLAKQHAQAGMWLYVWVGNEKAISFYTKGGFKIIGIYDFKISETHSNPNHQMLLKF